MRRADRRSLVLLVLALVPVAVMAWFSLQQWNDTSADLVVAQDAAAPGATLYQAYSFGNALSAADSTFAAAALPGSSGDVTAQAARHAATLDSELLAAQTELNRLLPLVADLLGESDLRTLELLDLARLGVGTELRDYEAGDPAPMFLTTLAASVRSQITTIVVSAVPSPSTAWSWPSNHGSGRLPRAQRRAIVLWP